MERILIFGNTHESREAAQTMRRRGKQVIVCVTTEYARAQLPPGTMCHIGRFDDGQMLSYIRQTNPRKVIDATHPYATATQTRIRRSAEQLGIPCQRMKIENEQEAWRDVVQWVENPAEAMSVLSRLSEENILLAGDYRNLPHYASLLRKDHLFCRIVPTVEALDLAKKVGVPETHIVAAYGPYTRAFNSAVFDMLGIDVLVIRRLGRVRDSRVGAANSCDDGARRVTRHPPKLQNSADAVKCTRGYFYCSFSYIPTICPITSSPALPSRSSTTAAFQPNALCSNTRKSAAMASTSAVSSGCS